MGQARLDVSLDHFAGCGGIDAITFYIGLGANPRANRDEALVSAAMHNTPGIVQHFLNLGGDRETRDWRPIREAGRRERLENMILLAHNNELVWMYKGLTPFLADLFVYNVGDKGIRAMWAQNEDDAADPRRIEKVLEKFSSAKRITIISAIGQLLLKGAGIEGFDNRKWMETYIKWDRSPAARAVERLKARQARRAAAG